MIQRGSLYENGIELDGRIAKVHVHQDYFVLETVDGEFAYLGLRDIMPQINSADYSILQASSD